MRIPDGNLYAGQGWVVTDNYMKIISVNIAKSKTIEFNGKTEQTGIYKEPSILPVMITKKGLERDAIIDKRVHGGENKAVYMYFQSHYDYWISETHRDDLKPGMFGENLTVSGIDESSICGGDKLRAGEALLEAVHFRLPCYKLGIKMGDSKFIKRFYSSERFGIYFKVIEEGYVKAGDAISTEYEHPARLKFSDLISMYVQETPDPALLNTALTIEALDGGLRSLFSKKISH